MSDLCRCGLVVWRGTRWQRFAVLHLGARYCGVEELPEVQDGTRFRMVAVDRDYLFDPTTDLARLRP